MYANFEYFCSILVDEITKLMNYRDVTACACVNKNLNRSFRNLSKRHLAARKIQRMLSFIASIYKTNGKLRIGYIRIRSNECFVFCQDHIICRTLAKSDWFMFKNNSVYKRLRFVDFERIYLPGIKDPFEKGFVETEMLEELTMELSVFTNYRI